MRGDINAATAQIRTLLAECAEPGWYGYGGQPLSEDAAQVATNLLRALPEDIGLPELAPESDGAIALDWSCSQNRLVSVSAGAGPRLAYAWLDGSEKGHGVAVFDGERFPPGILEVIRSIMKKGDLPSGLSDAVAGGEGLARFLTLE